MESMTGFGKGKAQVEGLTITVYAKSLNSKYLDIALKLPKKYTFLEERIRKFIGEFFSRGKIEVQIRCTGIRTTGKDIFLDLETAKNLKQSLELLRKELGFEEPVSFSDFIRFREYLMVEEKEEELDKLWEEVYPALKEALEDLKNSRKKEGEHLKGILVRYTEALEKEIGFIETIKPKVIEENRHRLKERIEKLAQELGLSLIDENRLYQELVFLLDKLDFTEELDRLKTHLKHFRETLDEGGAGKKLDFLCQEMFREINTLSNKAQSSEVSKRAVNVKDLIEKLREHIQNIA